MKSIENNVKDLMEIAVLGKANCPQLICDAYIRGLRDGKDLAKKKTIEAIEKEYNCRAN